SDERDERLAFQFIWTANHRRFGDLLIAHKRALDFRGADAMTGYVEDVIDAADNPKIPVFVLPATIAREVTALHFAPVNVLVSLRIAPDSAQHARPRFANDQFAAAVFRNDISLVIDYFREHAEEWERSAAGFGGSGAR